MMNEHALYYRLGLVGVVLATTLQPPVARRCTWIGSTSTSGDVSP